MNLGFTTNVLDAALRDDWFANGALAARAGDTVPGVPKFTATLSADYRWSISPDWHGLLAGSGTYIGEATTTFRSDDPARRRVGDYLLLDVRGGVVVGTCELTVFITNLADARAELLTDLPLARAPRTFVARPRTIGIQTAWGF